MLVLGFCFMGLGSSPAGKAMQARREAFADAGELAARPALGTAPLLAGFVVVEQLSPDGFTAGQGLAYLVQLLAVGQLSGRRWIPAINRYLVGEVTQVYGVGNHISRPEWPEADVFDVSLATLHFASGAIGNMASTCLLGWPHRIGLHLFCNRLAIELTEFELALHDGSGHPIRRAEGDPFVREDRDFIDAVQGKANRIRTPYAEALKTHRITVAATQSAREGTPITLTEEE